MPDAHSQTFGGRIFRAFTSVDYTRFQLPTPDGDFLEIDVSHDFRMETGALEKNFQKFLRTVDTASYEGIIVILHGLEGCSGSGYVKETVRNLRRKNFLCVVLNFRGCTGNPNRLRRYYHSGETGDLKFLLETINESINEPAIGAIGFSLGGNVLLKFLGEDKASARDIIDAAVAISVPYDLGAGARKIETGFGYVYTKYFLNSLKQKIRKKAEQYDHKYPIEEFSEISTLREFDDRVTAPVHGFSGAAEYYESCSSKYFVSAIRVPTLLIQAKNDQFQPSDTFPEKDAVTNQWIQPVFTERGGHVGFVEGSIPGRVNFWAEEQAAEFFKKNLA